MPNTLCCVRAETMRSSSYRAEYGSCRVEYEIGGEC